MSTNPQTAVAVVDYSPKTIQLPELDPLEYNLLVRGTTVIQSNPFLKPVIRQITLNQPGDTYPITQRKQGNDWVATEVGISAVGLANLADQASIQDVPQGSGRVDDGRDPKLVTYRSTIAMRMPDGEILIRTRECTVKLATLEKEIRAQKTAKAEQAKNSQYPWSTAKLEAEISKELLLKEKFMERLAETGAKNRAVKAILGLKQKYTPAEIARPFVFMAVVPDMDQPELRARMLEQAVSLSGALFGSAPAGTAQAPRQLAAGPSEDDVAEAVSEAEGGELAADELEGAATFREETTSTAADTTAGDRDEHPDDDDPMPDWANATKAPPAKAEIVAEPAPDLATRIRDTAAAGGMTGPAKEPQIETLKKLFKVIGGKATSAGLELLWPELDMTSLALTANRAQALINIARQAESYEAFAAEWRAMLPASDPAS